MKTTINPEPQRQARALIASNLLQLARQEPQDQALIRPLAWLASILKHQGADHDGQATPRASDRLKHHDGLDPIEIIWKGIPGNQTSTFHPRRHGRASYAVYQLETKLAALKERRQASPAPSDKHIDTKIQLIGDLLSHPVIAQIPKLEAYLREHCPPEAPKAPPQPKLKRWRPIVAAMLIALLAPLPQYALMPYPTWTMHHPYLAAGLPMLLTVVGLGLMMWWQTRQLKTTPYRGWIRMAPGFILGSFSLLLTGKLVQLGCLTQWYILLPLVHLTCLLIGIVSSTHGLLRQPDWQAPSKTGHASHRVVHPEAALHFPLEAISVPHQVLPRTTLMP